MKKKLLLAAMALFALTYAYSQGKGGEEVPVPIYTKSFQSVIDDAKFIVADNHYTKGQSELQKAIDAAEASIATLADNDAVREAMITLQTAIDLFVTSNDYVDATGMVQNPSFSIDGNNSKTITSWTVENFKQNRRDAAVYSTTRDGFSFNYFAEQWISAANGPLSGSGDISQVINGLPAGHFRLTADVFAHNQKYDATCGEAVGIQLYANDVVREIGLTGLSDTQAAAFSLDFDVAEGQKPTIGLRFNNTNVNWLGLDNMTLYFIGDSTIYNNSVNTITSNGISYKFITKAKIAEVISNSHSYSGNVVIPESVEHNGVTFTVVSIAENAFNNCTGLTSVSIPNTVTNIGQAAFANCSSLKNISIPNSVNSIEAQTFQKCSGLTSVIIPNSVTNIGNEAFSGCIALRNVTIPNSINYIGSNAFSGCIMLTQVHITDLSAWCQLLFSDVSSNPLNYAQHLYLNDEEITDLIIPNSVNGIGDYAFYNCNNLNTITIPSSVISIGNNAFSGCSKITTASIPNSITSIGNNAFSGCVNLTAIAIPNSVTNIGNNAFENCVNLTTITIPNSVTNIGNNTFKGCSGLISITISNSVNNIGKSAFEDCRHLTSITIPNNVTSIEENAFQNCSDLTTISIGNGIKNIYSSSFAYCPNITDLYCYATTVPSTNANVFKESYINYATLHVPEIAIENYKNTSPWSSIMHIVSIESGGQLFTLAISVNNTYGKVSYGTVDIANGQQTFSIKEGTDAVLTLTPNDGYRVATVTVNGEDKTAEVVDGQLTISNVTANVVVNIRFITAGETASVSIGSAGTATLCSAKDLDFTEVSGLKAYTGAGFNRTTGALTMLEVKDAPAGTGLVLIGSEGTYDIPVKPSASVYGNLLVGVTEDTQLAQTADGYTNYILGNGDHGLGFYIVTAEGGTLAAGKAYLRLPTVTANARRVISIEYGEGVTAVDDQRMMPKESDGSYYTLSGQRMTGTPSKAGVYIKDGHKVIIK